MGTEAEHAHAAASVSVPGYAIESVLSRGGMGLVHKARQLTLKLTVALRIVLTGGPAGPGELARFRIEVEAVALAASKHRADPRVWRPPTFDGRRSVSRLRRGTGKPRLSCPELIGPRRL